MTTAGKIFKSYAETIVAQHGFGSKKMIIDWSCGFLVGVKSKFNLITADGEKEMKASQIWNDCCNAQKFLIENGYLRQYTPKWKPKYGYCRSHYSTFVGLTDKGWSVAQRYIDAKEE